MRLTEGDVARLITACNRYKDQTGSEYMWDEYQHLIEKLERETDIKFGYLSGFTKRGLSAL